eukprot:2736908-Lingulodinium_polyedra.AAC.1
MAGPAADGRDLFVFGDQRGLDFDTGGGAPRADAAPSPAPGASGCPWGGAGDTGAAGLGRAEAGAAIPGPCVAPTSLPVGGPTA